ncbi:hypothetical protein [Arthrobacter sp. SX1312]|uniref:hypothetical protein n=1 Tax=Arthrobacter sp. SX1312 TaxID=2058896 RepID=UPI000CE319D3|nr:hypothetical protein [Arthrobacter sp. SX1312]
MTTNRATHTVLFLLRATVPSVVAFVGLTAVIVGVLAMHVWMGGHGSTSHHVASPAAATTTIPPGAEAGLAPSHTLDTHTGHETGPVHTQATTAAKAAVTALGAIALDAAATVVLDGSVLYGCAEDCADEMMLGMCVLAMIVIGIAGLLTPAGRALLSTLGRRGPPALPWVSRPAPAPSLIQLCISRT